MKIDLRSNCLETVFFLPFSGTRFLVKAKRNAYTRKSNTPTVCDGWELDFSVIDWVRSEDQHRSQNPWSSVTSVRGFVRLWEKAQKNGREFTASITIGSSTLGKHAIYKLVNDGALARSWKYCSNSCPGIKTLNHIESEPVKEFVMNI